MLSPGQHASALYYIQSGLIKGSVEGPLGKISTWFRHEDDLLLPQGLFHQHSSEEYITAITKTTLLAISTNHLQKVMVSFPQAADLVILIMEESLRQGQHRETMLHIPAAKDRYAFLAQHEPYILKRVPHYLIASYLNVTRETFSRLHRGLAY